MAVRTRVQRGAPKAAAGDEVGLPEGYGDDPGGDVAMVGGGDEGAAALQIDPSLAEDNDDWDKAGDGKDKDRQEPEPRRTVEVEVDDDDGRDDGQDDDDDPRLAYDLDNEGRDSERDSQREPSRRQRRNRSRRELVDRSSQEIETLRGQVAQMQGLLQQVTGGQAHLAVNTIDNQMRAAQQSLELADDLMAKAIAEGDGKAFAQLQKSRDEAVGQIYQLRSQRARIEASVRAQAADPRLRQVQEGPRVDPTLANRAEEMGNRFLDRNPWFNPEGTDRDSRMARVIDEELAQEGYMPHTSAFWIQFETRCKEAGLGGRTQRQATTDDRLADDRPEPRREAPQGRREANMPPTGVVRSTRGPGRPSFTLSQAQVSILEEEGLMGDKLSDADKARKTRIVTAWRDGAKKLQSGR